MRDDLETLLTTLSASGYDIELANLDGDGDADTMSWSAYAWRYNGNMDLIDTGAGRDTFSPTTAVLKAAKNAGWEGPFTTPVKPPATHRPAIWMMPGRIMLMIAPLLGLIFGLSIGWASGAFWGFVAFTAVTLFFVAVEGLIDAWLDATLVDLEQEKDKS